MSAAEVIAAFERSLITEAEAIEQTLVDSLNDVYRKAVLEMAPHLAARSVAGERLPC